MIGKLTVKQRRGARIRRSIRARAKGRPRLSVHRSNANIYAQIIDDAQGRTLVAASSLEKGAPEKGGNAKAAEAVGKMIAERALKAGIKEVVFDRGAFIYHGRLKALAESARQEGLSF